MNLGKQLGRLLVGLMTLFMVSGKPVQNTKHLSVLVTKYINSLAGTSTGLITPNVEKVNLYARVSGTYVRITDTGVDASSKTTTTDPDSFVIILNKYGKGRVTIKGKKSGKYICFNTKSDVIVRPSFKVGCLFIEKKNRKNYFIFESVHNNTWFLAFTNRMFKNKSVGKPKAGRKTARGNRSIMFLKTTVI